MADKKERVKVTALLRPEIKEKLEARAEANDRAVGYEISRIISEALKGDDKAPKGSE